MMHDTSISIPNFRERSKTMNTDYMIEQLKAITEYTNEDYGYQRYMRREMFEQLVVAKLGADLCDCCPLEDALADIYDALIFATINDESRRKQFLIRTFEIEDTCESPSIQMMFYILTMKGFMTHRDGEDFNNSVLTPLGKAFLPLLFEYMFSTPTSKIAQIVRSAGSVKMDETQ